ncbi:Phosphopantothenoylcysteine decarboxylase [Phycisphaerae bacterium RAS1]|nr:Phosphopantothenoylcysteine decarboxylase [Phycisphaerae bacterium RAS1]
MSLRPDAAAATPLKGRELLVCVCGGIAAYKTAEFVSQAVQAGCGVTVAMTRNARRFVGELTFQALSGRPVLTSQWESSDAGEIRHLKASERAERILVAPATANILGKLAAGIADDLVSSILLGAACPVLLAPAMNTRMWQHPAVQRNIAFLREAGFTLIGPEAGWLACREVGPGRMSEPRALLDAVAGSFPSA